MNETKKVLSGNLAQTLGFSLMTYLLLLKTYLLLLMTYLMPYVLYLILSYNL